MHNLRVRAATVDHGLRPASAAEAATVGTLCAARGIPHDTLPLSLSDGADLQARARDARYAALADWARWRGVRSVLLGHTADDVAETLLMRLNDGAGLNGLSAMAPRFSRFGVTFLRPFHTLRRNCLRDFVLAQGVTPIDDPSNENPRFERVRVRQLIRDLGLPVDQLAASARALSEVRTSVEAQTLRLATAYVSEDRGDLLIKPHDLAALLGDAEQARRVLLRALSWINGGTYPPRRAEQVELMRRVAAGEDATLAGCLLRHRATGLRIAREPAAALRARDAVPGTVWDGRWRVTARGGDLSGLSIRALGGAVTDVDWRAIGLPRSSVMARPAIWRGAALLAVPGLSEGWRADCEPVWPEG
ncbi:tRNA lysidine(34) synthetase TilS [Jannaschia sp. M317]|uniref:tRNA lysidine(34) synthetase TilS n=1 Tax=Jannaschia sp. M317 TaxID=2867011 RepID=UPI0021A69C48|nr:tRNA lysidine(34) synthetase TilS [Jannaschia sp. M317]